MGAQPLKHDHATGERDTRAPLSHVAPGERHRPHVLIDDPRPGDITRTAEYEQRVMTIRDGRPIAAGFDLEGAGFAFGRYPTRVRDFDDETEIRDTLYPETEALLQWGTGAERVIIFDHTLRTSEGTGRTDGRRAVHIVHNDYSEKSGPERAADILELHAPGTRLPTHYAIVNAWRPVDRPVERDPLALLDARSVSPDDLRPTTLVYPDRFGEIYELTHARHHRWYWFPRMTPDEVLLFKQYDTRRDRARFTPHSAFAEQYTPADAPPRRSIELRALILLPETSAGQAGTAWTWPKHRATGEMT